MGEAFIVRRGGNPLRNAYAVIYVTYPAGSVCTCTKGTKVLKAGNTHGAWAFPIQEDGTWTVSCTDGTNTASKSVVIDTVYQAESIALSYGVYIYNNGEEYSAATGGWRIVNRSGGIGEKETARIKAATKLSGDQRESAAFTVNTMFRGEKTLLKADIDVVQMATGSNGVTLGMTARNDIGNPTFTYSTNTKELGRQTVTVDISEYTGNVNYPAIMAQAAEAYVYAVWFE